MIAGREADMSGFPLWWHILVNDLTGARTQRFVNAFNAQQPPAVYGPPLAVVKHVAGSRQGVAIFRNRSFLSMGVVKDDDSTITWDAEAMAKRAFREVQP